MVGQGGHGAAGSLQAAGGAVDQDIEAGESLRTPSMSWLDAIEVTDVGLQGAAPGTDGFKVCDYLGCVVCTAVVVDDYLSAEGAELHGDGPADAAGTAGYEGDLPSRGLLGFVSGIVAIVGELSGVSYRRSGLGRWAGVWLFD